MGRNPHLKYPAARISPVVDDFHGTPVADPYRWLEDPASGETQRWVAAQNALTSSVLDGHPRTALVSELTNLYNYPRTSVPIKRGGRYFFTFNSGLQNQPSLYVQNAVDERPRLLINPNILSEDGTAALTAFFVDDGGTRVAYGISRSGSDRQEFFVRDVAKAGAISRIGCVG